MPHLDGRLLVVAGYLAQRIEGKVILDLNCGRAPLLRYLPRGFARYVGNDTTKGYIENCREAYPYGEWHLRADDELPELERLDILLCLGYAARLNIFESQTLDITVRKLVTKHKPELVCLDVAVGIGVYGPFMAMVDWMTERGYKERSAWYIEPVRRDGLAFVRRRVSFLEREV